MADLQLHLHGLQLRAHASDFETCNYIYIFWLDILCISAGFCGKATGFGLIVCHGTTYR